MVITFDDEVYDMVLLGKFFMLTVGLRCPLVAECFRVVRVAELFFGDSYLSDLHTRCTEQFCPSLVINRHTRDNATDAGEAALEMVQLCTQVRFSLSALDALLMPRSLNSLPISMKISDPL